MYLQHQLLDGAQLHLPDDVSHLIYHIPVSGTASTDGEICPVCPVLSFSILCYTSVTSKLDFCNSRKDRKPLTCFLLQNSGRGTVKIIDLLTKSFLVIHPTLVLWERGGRDEIQIYTNT